MNEIFIYQDQREKQRQQIISGVQDCLHVHSYKFYSQKQRVRQKNQNYLISSLKKSTKNINPETKRQLYVSTVKMMNFYLPSDQHLSNIVSQQQHKRRRKISKQSGFMSIEEEENYLDGRQQWSQKPENQKGLNLQQVRAKFLQNKRQQSEDFGQDNDLGKIQTQRIEQQLEQNFYQLYINTFVTFFNHKSFAQDSKVKPQLIKNIIRPNNRFVLMDLLKALLEYSRKDFKEILNNSTFYFKEPVIHQIKTECIQFEDQSENIDFNDGQDGDGVQKARDNFLKMSSSSEHQNNQDQIKRRIHTEPQINSIFNNHLLKNTRTAALSKASTLSLARNQQTQGSKHTQTCPLFDTFIQSQIKLNILQRNGSFTSQLNLDKLQNRMNSLFIELTKLNYVNSEMIDRFFEHAIGRKQKFNYDCRGLYSEKEKQKKKEFIRFQISKLQNLTEPSSQSMSFGLAQYAQAHIKKNTYLEQLRTLESKKGVSPYPSSPWIPLYAQLSNSVFNPINLCIYEINALSSDPLVYHWTKYRKQYQMTEFMKEKVKNAYNCSLSTELIDLINNNDKKGFNSLFKKFKFRKNLFIDSKKRINELLQSNNNLIISKKESIFPTLKGIQENFIKNSNRVQTQTQINPQAKYSLGTISTKNIDRIKESSSAQLKTIQVIDKKIPQLNYMRSTGQRRNDSKSERRLLDLRDKESPKVKKDKPEFLTRLVAKYDINPPKMNTPKYEQDKIKNKKEKYEKKNMISMTRITSSELKSSEFLKTKDFGNGSPLKNREVSSQHRGKVSNNNKLSILNLLQGQECIANNQGMK